MRNESVLSLVFFNRDPR